MKARGRYVDARPPQRKAFVRRLPVIFPQLGSNRGLITAQANRRKVMESFLDVLILAALTAVLIAQTFFPRK